MTITNNPGTPYEATLGDVPSRICERCAGTGTLGRSTLLGSTWVRPGPVPDDAADVYEVTCDECGGSGDVQAAI